MPTIAQKPTKASSRRSRAERSASLPRLTVTRPDQFHALADATRWRILGRLLEGPASVQELAVALRRAKGTIGHHVRVLERAGLVRIAETRQVRGVIEKRYVRTAGKFDLGEATPDTAPQRGRGTMLPVRVAITEARPPRGRGDPSSSFAVRARMPAARARRFARLMDDLAREFVDGAPGTGETFGLIGGVYVPDWSAKRGEDEE